MTFKPSATLVVPRFWPARGGSELHSRELAQALIAAGHPVNVVCHSSTDEFSPELAITRQISGQQQDGPCPVHRVCPTGLRRNVMGWLAERHATVRPLRPLFDFLLRKFSKRAIAHHARGQQLIHSIYNGLTSAAEAALMAAREQDVPFIWSPLANTDLPEGQGWSSPRFCKLYQQADALIALTQHEKEWLEAHGAPAERTFVCPMGPMVSAPSSTAEFRNTNQLDDNPVVLFLGRHDEAKGYHLLLNSARDIWSAHPDVQLLFIGPQTEESRKRFAAIKDSRITVIEDISQADKNAALATADLLCVPSIRESLGVVYLEAWHYHKPVVALDIPVLRSVIADGQDGVLCKTDGSDLALKVSHLLDNAAERNRLGAAGRQTLDKQYSWSSIVQKHQEIYSFALKHKEQA
ncbi:glycosyltransferase family 4 protein [Marinobacter sp.]|uniref:glycosyltransferase family 4 protein n=1 Tax=Marinobacter sp. TaxID=50741 RepID=UPI002B267EE9|nr:glycosyltransferase family 4 protein [Marinobacter sp.]